MSSSFLIVIVFLRNIGSLICIDQSLRCATNPTCGAVDCTLTHYAYMLNTCAQSIERSWL